MHNPLIAQRLPRFLCTCVGMMACSLFTPSATATPYLYIDATPANTTLDGAALVHGTNVINNGTTGSGTDGLWTYRTDSAAATFEGAAYFESDNANVTGDAENTAPLVTTLTLPAPGTYEFVAVFTRLNNRDITARIGAAPTAGDIFTLSNALNANQAAVPLEIEFDNSYANTRSNSAGAAYLGQITTATANQAVSIFINGFDSLAGTQDERTQYDGIGYRPYVEPPPPEPVHRDVFILAGQSNADGRGLKSQLSGGLAAYADQQPGAWIHYTNPAYTNSDKSRYHKWMPLEPGYSVPPGYSGALPSTTFGHEIGAGKVLSTHFPNPAFIKVCRGGTALGVPGTDWYPAPLDSPDAGPLYKALIESTQLALAEIEALGDTYTLHAIFWHQGESDGSRTAEYAALLTTLIESVRRDLGMPNLRFIVGELADTKPQAFRDVQWNVARTVPNAGFVSSRNLATSDNTHFDAAAMITFGERLGHALLPARSVLNFEPPPYTTGALDRQDEWIATQEVAVVATANQDEYTGGQAAGHKGASGLHQFSRRNVLPLAGARAMQADFFPGDAGFDNEGDADSTLLVAGWRLDADQDGLFSDSEAAIGLGLHQTGTFRIQIGGTTHLASPFTYQIDRWYRLTLTWSEPDAAGIRTVNLFARDLETGADLSNGAPILSIEVPSDAFDGNPARWLGLGSRTTRGLIDNIQITPPGFSSWASSLDPPLVGGPQDDDDGDGIPNAIEFAFGLDPLRPNPASVLPQPVYGNGTATLSFAPLANQPGILHLVDWSRNLTSWTTVSGTRSGNLLEFTIPTTGEPALFLRHRVEVTD